MGAGNKEEEAGARRQLAFLDWDLFKVRFRWVLWREQASRKWKHNSVQAAMLERSVRRQHLQCQYEKLGMHEPH